MALRAATSRPSSGRLRSGHRCCARRRRRFGRRMHFRPTRTMATTKTIRGSLPMAPPRLAQRRRRPMVARPWPQPVEALMLMVTSYSWMTRAQHRRSGACSAAAAPVERAACNRTTRTRSPPCTPSTAARAMPPLPLPRRPRASQGDRSRPPARWRTSTSPRRALRSRRGRRWRRRRLQRRRRRLQRRRRSRM